MAKAKPARPVTKAKDPYTDGSGGWPIPAFDYGMTFSDIGSSGLRQYGGWVREEFLPQLQGRQAARVYREMLDNSSIVGSLIFAITQSMRKIEWRVRPASDKPEARAEAEFAESLMGDMSHSWEDFIAETLSMLGYGFAPHEIVYKRRLGPNPRTDDRGRMTGGSDPSSVIRPPSSLYNDGRIGLRRLPLRGQDTILKWFFGTNGEILGLTQQPWIGPLIDIPVEKLLLFRPTLHKNNPEGRSILRNSYRPYYFIKRLEEIEAIYFERMSGLPVMYVPSTLLEAVAGNDPKAIASYNAYKKLITNIRADEQMGAILPSDCYQGPNGPTGTRMYELQLMTPQGGNTRAQFNTAIERYKLEVLMTALADFIQLGHAAHGTQNLAVSKVDMFFQAIEGWLNSIAAILNRYLLPRVWALNGIDLALLPEYVPDLAQRVDLDTLSNFVLRLAQAGMTLFPDPDLEDYIRDAAGLPEISDEADGAPDRQNGDSVPNDAAALRKMLLASYAKRVKKLRRYGAKAGATPG